MKIKNRSASVVVYNIPDMHVRRRFIPGEVKDVTAEELRQLKYQPGGEYLLAHYLQVSQEDYPSLDMAEPEREYFYTDEQIKELITTASLDEFLDALDYAPEGVINMFKEYSTTLPMTDLQKINAFRERTGYDVAEALKNAKAVASDEGIEIAAPVRQRRVDKAPSKYRVISD